MLSPKEPHTSTLTAIRSGPNVSGTSSASVRPTGAALGGALPTIRTTKQKDRFREDFATLDPEVVSACPARDKVTVMHKPGTRNAELRHMRMALAASQGRVDKLESCIGWLQRGIKRAGFESDDDFDEWCNRTGERLVAVAVEEKLQQVALSRFVARHPATNLRAWELTVEHAALQQFRSGHLRS